MEDDAQPVTDKTVAEPVQEQVAQRSAPRVQEPAPVDHAAIAKLAEDLDLKPSEYMGMRSAADAHLRMLQDVRERSAQRHVEPDSAPISSRVSVEKDAVDKAQDAAYNFISARSGVTKIDASNPLAGMSSMRDAAVCYVDMLGARNAHRMSDRDKACLVLGDFRNMSEGARSAFNVTTSSFPDFINANIVTKIVAEGLEQSRQSITYPEWSRRREVPDFKQYRYGALGTANLQKTPSGEDFPELAKSEGFYNSNINKWGGTLSLTIEALVNDDVGEFMDSLAMAPFILEKTKERRCFERLLGTDWTGNTTVGDISYETADEIVAARAALDDVIAGFMEKEGLDGNPLNNVPSAILAPIGLAGQARGITSGVAPGQPNTAHQGAMRVIQSAWLSASTLTGNSSSSYYLLANPSSVRGMTEAVLAGYPGIVVDERDPGKAGGRLWTMWSAFEFDLPVIDGIVAGAHRGTAS